MPSTTTRPERARPCLGDSRRLADRTEPQLHILPQGLVDDTQLGHLGDEPFGLGIETGQAPAGARVLHIALPVPQQPADVELVVKHTGATQSMAADRGIAPGSAAWACDMFGIEPTGDRPRRDAGCELI